MYAKKRVFIASSREAKEKGVYDKVVEAMHDEYEVIDWQRVMKSNHCVLDCLIEQSLKVDKAIFIGTADDKVSGFDPSRGDKIQHRDNVIFELGLFMGALGKENCIYLVEQKSLDSVMSDYKGINVFPFDVEKSVYPIREMLSNLESSTLVTQSIFPSITLATIYFDNFIQPMLSNYINNDNKLKIKGSLRGYKTFSVIILIPEIISSDINLQTQCILNQYKAKCKQGSIDSSGRARQINYYLENNELCVVDIPSVLSGLRSLLDNILPKSRSCDPDDYDTIINREVNRFISILKLRIVDTSYASNVQIKCVYERELKEVASPKTIRIEGWQY